MRRERGAQAERRSACLLYTSIRLAYRDFDKIVPIREGLDAVTLRSFPGVQPEKIHIAHNVNDIEGIREKAALPLAFDADTYCNMEPEQVAEILGNRDNLIFTNIARFSVEKGLDRLVRAFLKFSACLLYTSVRAARAAECGRAKRAPGRCVRCMEYSFIIRCFAGKVHGKSRGARP